MHTLSHRLPLRQDSFTLALVASLLVHVLLLSLWGAARQVHLLQALTAKAIEPDRYQEEKRLQFELVETPPDAQTEPPTQETRLLSDKNMRARDLYAADDKAPGEPYSDGQSPYRTFAGSIEAQGADAATTPRLAPGESAASGQVAENKALPQGVSLADMASGTAQRGRFTPEVLAGAPSSHRSSSYGSDDASYRQVTFSAEDLGGVTLNTYAWDFAPYLLQMKRKIRENVYPPAAFTRLGIISGETVLRFRVLPDGQITNLEVLGYTGHPSLKETSVLAVVNAAPFKPLPKAFPEEYLELTWTFIYSVTRQ